MYTLSVRTSTAHLPLFNRLLSSLLHYCFDEYFGGWAMIGALRACLSRLAFTGNFTGMLGKSIGANVLLTPSGDETAHVS